LQVKQGSKTQFSKKSIAIESFHCDSLTIINCQKSNYSKTFDNSLLRGAICNINTFFKNYIWL